MSGRKTRERTVSTPGRICLFGEHQDYLLLPVIAAAVSTRLCVHGAARNDRVVDIRFPDIDGRDNFSLDEELTYSGPRDFVRSAVNVLKRHGFTFSSGFDCVVKSRIPINAGTSSSSALAVSWMNFLAGMSDQRKELDPVTCARFAHEAEVIEFDGPGGMMDQYATAVGGVTFIAFEPETSVERLPASLGSFVLGDSGQPKNTSEILSRVKTSVHDITAVLGEKGVKVPLRAMTRADAEEFGSFLDPGQKALLSGTVENHMMTLDARQALQGPAVDEERFGALLWKHQVILRDVLQISTGKIDRMLDAAMAAGALGGKINGSGGGGCMFVYAPRRTEEVAEAIAREGGVPSILSVDSGTRVEENQGCD